MTQPNDEEAQVSTRKRGWTKDMDRRGVCVYFAGFSRVPCKVLLSCATMALFTSAELETGPDRGWIG